MIFWHNNSSGALEIETVTIPDFSSEIFTTQEIVLTVVLAQKEALKSEDEKTKINFSTKILSNEDDDSTDSDSEVQVKTKKRRYLHSEPKAEI
jgi:hypothetical protein